MLYNANYSMCARTLQKGHLSPSLGLTPLRGYPRMAHLGSYLGPHLATPPPLRRGHSGEVPLSLILYTRGIPGMAGDGYTKASTNSTQQGLRWGPKRGPKWAILGVPRDLDNLRILDPHQDLGVLARPPPRQYGINGVTPSGPSLRSHEPIPSGLGPHTGVLGV